MRKEKLIVCMPVYNEEEVIEEVVRKNHKFISKYPNGQLVVSEDGSSDKTKDILKKLQKELKFVLHTSPKRKGAVQGQKDSIQYALDAGADYVMLTDSDNQHDPQDFAKMLEYIPEYDMVVGYKVNRQDPKWRQIGSKFWNFYNGVLFGMNFHDINCGFKIMSREMLQAVYPKTNLYHECYTSELVVRANAEGFKIKEVEVTHLPRETAPRAWNSKKIPGMGMRLFREALKLRTQLPLFPKKRVRDTYRMNNTYSSYYDEEYSFRENWFGRIAHEYIMPKYVKKLEDFVGADKKNLTFVEIGAGDGEVTDLIRKRHPTWKITPTEIVEAGVVKLKKKGYKDAAVVDAVKLPYKDEQFDYAICFDVMHHVDGPAKMASEMVRVSKKGAFLIEASRESITRRMLEKTQIYKRAGEFSYYAIEYKAFFNLPDVSTVRIHPFQFIPPKISNISLGLTKAISEIMEHVPVLRWQCSGVAIEVTKKS